ncbi:flagellin [Pseudoalteromonas sp. MelDa3]|uniref:flagellin n=1 Tax=Pseudoalteromonas sp. MelDa3 TaxID=888435 RepID=UPI0035B515DD
MEATSGAGANTASGNIQSYNGSLATPAVVGTAITTTSAANETGSKSAIVTGRLDFSDAVLDQDLGALSIVASGTNLGNGTDAGVAALETTTKLTKVSDIDISTTGGSQSAIDVIDAALKSIDSERADLGAVQNRFDHTISNLANISENVSASRSRIQDTDFATETAQMTKNQILQQAGTSILSQANQLPQAALSLLG